MWRSSSGKTATGLRRVVPRMRMLAISMHLRRGSVIRCGQAVGITAFEEALADVLKALPHFWVVFGVWYWRRR